MSTDTNRPNLEQATRDQAPEPSPTVVYSVLYSVPVPGLTVEAMATAQVTVGPLGGKPYTTIRDIPKIIELRHGYRAGDVTVINTIELPDAAARRRHR